MVCYKTEMVHKASMFYNLVNEDIGVYYLHNNPIKLIDGIHFRVAWTHSQESDSIVNKNH